MPGKNFILLVVYLLVPLASNFTKGWTSYQIIYKVFDQLENYSVEHSGRLWSVNRTNLLGIQNISFMKHEIISWNTFTLVFLVFKFHSVCFSSIKKLCLLRKDILQNLIVLNSICY